MSLLQAEASKSDKLYLYIDLPKFDFPVIFAEQVSDLQEFRTDLILRFL